VSSAKTTTLMAVGDMMLGDCPISFGFGVGSMVEKHGPHFLFDHCRDRLKDADILFGNLEAVLSAFDWSRAPFERMRLRGQPKAALGLKDVGFSVLSLANNHIMQHGRAAVEETVEHLRRLDIAVCGLDIPEMNLSNPVLINRNGLRFCFLAYNQRPQQYFIDSRVDVCADLDTMERDIIYWRERTDCLIVSLHWGDEYISYPSSKQVGVAHRLVDLGVDIILGHHPHVLQGIETYKGSVIAYSLGNFIFDMTDVSLRTSVIMKCTIAPPRSISYSIIPVLINRLYQPVILSGLDNTVTMIMERLTELICERHDDSAYCKELLMMTRRYRRKDILRYLTSIVRYKPRHLFSNVFGMIKRRLYSS
jgi:gamma-polyglutamate biosynthesis protein CapA